jgi:D-glycero-D-manno-heptose 1,7-bisphosphate phosphatase
MVLEAAADFQIDLAASFFVGDKAIDIECGRRACTRTILVRTGYGAALERDPNLKPDFIADDAPAAVRWLLQQ